MFERWERQFGDAAAFALAFASMQVPPTTLRTRAGEREAVAAQLREQGVETNPGRFAPNTLSIRGGDFYDSEVFRGGEVVVQDEASQLVAALVAPRRGDRVLDLCAAPGIKTAQIAEALGEGTLMSCDVSAARLATMKRLLDGRIPQGVQTEVLLLDATLKLPFAESFDRALVDAPCSGTGTLARNPEIKWRLQSGEFERLSKMQTAILKNTLATLAPGGRLVYATCSLEPEENEKVVEAVLAAYPGFRLLGKEDLAQEFPAWAELFDPSGYFRTRPEMHGMDGFFAAVITRV
jgi:16S rRNA (cytosine967-C5)-methyltransferase